MSDDPPPLKFYHLANPVGVFETAAPLAPGRYPYMPYRGPGHLDMSWSLRRGEQPWCCYRTPDHVVHFRVAAVFELFVSSR